MSCLGRPSLSFVASPTLLGVPPQKTYPLFFPKNYPNCYILKNKSTSIIAPISCAQEDVVSHHKVEVKKDDNENCSKVGPERGESTVPKHVALCLDGNRRWLKMHGRDLDYWPFFQANMRFAEYCLKWGIGTATTLIYGIGNMNHRTKEANDLFIGQFEKFLEEGLAFFTMEGVKVSILGELSMLPDSCKATIKRVEEATKNNKKLEFVLPMCYTSQRDIVEATKKLCMKVKEGTLELEDINEGLFEQHLSICGSRPPLDLFIRTGGNLRIGMLLAWQVPHAELYFSDTYAPDFGEDVFIDAMHSFQQRVRLFGK